MHVTCLRFSQSGEEKQLHRRHSQKDDIKVDLEEIFWWSVLAEFGLQWPARSKHIMTLFFLEARNFLARLANNPPFKNSNIRIYGIIYFVTYITSRLLDDSVKTKIIKLIMHL
jgi:hypothetical protein